MNSTPLVALVFNRRHTATTTKEAAVELRVSYQKEQKYMSTGVRLLPKHWRRGMVINRVDAIQLNQTLEKLVVDVRKVILQMMTEGSIDIFTIPCHQHQPLLTVRKEIEVRGCCRYYSSFLRLSVTLFRLFLLISR